LWFTRLKAHSRGQLKDGTPVIFVLCLVMLS
jgi:hypothetical protein